MSRDDGPRWLPKPERPVAERPADAPPPAAGAPPVAPAVRGPSAANLPNLPPEALPAQLRAGPWRTYAVIAAVALLASVGVAAALYFAARSPTSRERAETATRLLTTGTTPSTTAPVAASAAPLPQPLVPIPSAAPLVPVPSAIPSAVASASGAPAPASDEGTIRTPPESAGHRVFVDGHYAGDSPGPIKVRCGQHVVKVGSGGSPRPVDVPCGGDVLVLTR